MPGASATGRAYTGPRASVKFALRPFCWGRMGAGMGGEYVVQFEGRLRGEPAAAATVMERWLERDNPGTGTISPRPGELSLTGRFYPMGAHRRTGIHIGEPSANPPMGWIYLEARGDGDTQCTVTAKDGDWPELRATWDGLRAELVHLGFLAAVSVAKERDERGMNSGTPERVKAFHELVKHHKTHNEAKRKSHCDPRTYYDRCKEVTGEDPIYPLLPE